VKKLIIIFLLISTAVSASNDWWSRYAYKESLIITLGLDPKLAIGGAYEYDDTPVLDFTFSVVTSLEKHEIGIFCEYADLDPYLWAFGVLYNRKFVVLKKEWLETTAGLEVKLLQRGFHPSKKREWITLGFNATTRFYITDWFAASLRFNATWRRELINTPIKLSGFIEVSFIITRN